MLNMGFDPHETLNYKQQHHVHPSEISK